jgi:GH25 family lysozyme M1 (1,4-beta-N-acetylmuramidase)
LHQLSASPATLPPPSAAGAIGVDVAGYQHPGGAAIDWPKVAAAGYKFAFIKATEGDYYANPYYASDLAQAKAAGLYAAGYHFAVPNVSGGASQADYALANDGYAPDGRTLPLALDIEYNPYGPECYGLSAPQMVSWVSAFTAEAQRVTGQRPIIYTTADWWDTCTGDSTAFGSDPLWVAAYRSAAPPVPAGWGNWTFWQYTSRGSVPGITGYTDVSYFLQAAAGLLDPGSQQNAVGTAVQLQVTSLNAADGQSPQFAASDLPPGLSISSSGMITGTISPAASGTYEVTVTATSSSGATGSASFPWTVTSGQPSPSPSLSRPSSPSPSPFQLPSDSAPPSPSPSPSGSASASASPSDPPTPFDSPTPSDSALPSPPATESSPGGPVTADDSKAHCIIPHFPGGVLDQSVINQISGVTGITYNCLGTFANPAPDWTAWEQPWMFSTTSDGWDAWLAADPAHQVVMGMDLIPQSVSDTSDPVAWEQPCAAGGYDQYATALAQNLVSYGAGGIVIRLGVEANGNWEADYVGTTTQEMSAWAQCFDNEVTAMRAVPGAHFLFVWNPNVCTADLPLGAWYPGDSYVDIIGIDAYDQDCSTLKTVSQEGWAAYAADSSANNPNDPNFPSLDNIEAFAAAHGKPLAFPEWGLDTGLPDDTDYVAGMAQMFSQDDFSFESYFDVGDDGTAALGPDIPDATAAYSQAFR